MKKKLLLIAILLFPVAVFSQDISLVGSNEVICRSWSWTSEDGTEQFEIDLTKVDGAIKGNHCSVAYNGRYIDCSDEDISIDLRLVGENIFEGTIRSGYSRTNGKIRLTFDKSSNTLHFELLEEPSGIFYLPKDVVME